MARITIPENAGQFKITFSSARTYIVTNGKSGGNRIIISCKTREQAGKLLRRLNERDESRELIIWM